MPVVMMMGMMIFVGALVGALVVAGVAREVFANPIPVIDAAGAGTALLGNVQLVHAASAWLVPLKFLGVATEFLAITMGLATIINILGAQTNMLDKGFKLGRKILETS
jgi:hypothetical protein